MDREKDREELIKALMEILSVSREELLATPKQTIIDGISGAIGTLKKRIETTILDVVGPSRVWNGTKEELAAAVKKRDPVLGGDNINSLKRLRLATMELL